MKADLLRTDNILNLHNQYFSFLDETKKDIKIKRSVRKKMKQVTL